MGFEIGDKVIHWAHGLGEIVQIEERIIGEQFTNCYVVKTPSLTIWVPINEMQQHSLRHPTSPEEFAKIFTILKGPGETLLEDRVLRKNQLMAQMNGGQLLPICQVIRDLTHLKLSKKLNEVEKSILERATNSLLTEWAYSMEVTLVQAHQAMLSLLTLPQAA